MTRSTRRLRLLILAAVAAPLATASAGPRGGEPRTPLDAYVHAEDPAYGWKVLHRVPRPRHTELIVELTSQQWRDAAEVSRTEWRHTLSIVVPAGAASDAALLLVTGGANDRAPPDRASHRLRQAAHATGSVVAELSCVPNQPLRVLTSSRPEKPRKEDDLLAASWVECIETEDPTWLAQLPMAKSAVAAMTAVQEAVARVDGAPSIERFTVAGASKRGWTAWLAAAVDDRVAAVAPIVIDVLNIAPSMKHHLASYGRWSRALQDYERQGLADRLDDPESAAIRAIVDPYVYRERLTMPKCLINASGDEFFLPDSSRFYFDDLVGEKHLSYAPNAGHALRGSDALDTLVAFHASIAHGLERPTLSWDSAYDAPVHTVRCSAEPTEATLWRAVNPSARDFRLPVIGEAFQPTPLEPQPDGSYRVPISAPERGFSATFARFSFDIGASKPFRVSTPVWVSPDVEPFAGKE
ncbi:MAG: PhoPQ-activated protein PqaA family protein [Planctomycetota bacterium]